MKNMSEASASGSELDREEAVQLVDTVDALSEETKDLALNLALYLAKVKANKTSERLQQMEPEFIRLVNSTIRVIRELTVILNAAKNREKMVYQLPSGNPDTDHIQVRLESISEQCNLILESLNQARDLLA